MMASGREKKEKAGEKLKDIIESLKEIAVLLLSSQPEIPYE
jgi:hypothetical protein